MVTGAAHCDPGLLRKRCDCAPAIAAGDATRHRPAPRLATRPLYVSGVGNGAQRRAD